MNVFNIFFKEQLQDRIKNTINISLDEISLGKYNHLFETKNIQTL